MGWEEVVGKYRECAEYAGLPQQGVDVMRAVDMVRGLEDLPKAKDLLESLTPTVRTH
jgi:hypothetical protein